MTRAFDAARAIADAVLLEGYVLYPYRASSRKNQFRFAFGVLAPRAWSEAGGCEPWWTETQCLVEGSAPRVEGRLRCMQVVRRTVEERAGDGAFRATGALDAGGQLRIPWDEGELRELPIGPLALGGEPLEQSIELAGAREEEIVRGSEGQIVGRVVRSRSPIHARVALRTERIDTARIDTARIDTERIDTARPLWRVSIRVENLTPGAAPGAPRESVLASSLVSTHLMLACEEGAFVSLIDPPAWAREAAGACVNVRCHPVLAGPEGARDLILSAPIILYDHPQIAPESPGDFCDATEIDEILALRTAMLTDEEKREVRATDPRAAAIVDRVDSLPPEVMERLHGAIRERGLPSPAFARGDRVRLRPGHRRTDAQDLLFAGCTATIEAVMKDVEGRDHLAVIIDDDPAADLHRWYGRFHYYYPDEVEPMERAPAASEPNGGEP